VVNLRIGVLALQGNYARHAQAFDDLDQPIVEVRHVREVEDLDGLIIPGGETTTLLNLMQDEPWFEALGEFYARGGALFGTCAGAILLSREVHDPVQPSLGLLDATIRRNAFGRQIDSFEARIGLAGSDQPLTAVFIRAPRFEQIGSDVDVLARLDDEPVLLRQGQILAATFHPELTTDRQLQRMFIEMAGRASRIKETKTEDRTVDAPVTVPLNQERRITC
jgi:5'-phosphate synthase pdxT subunit